MTTTIINNNIINNLKLHQSQRVRELHDKAMHAVLQYGQLIDLKHPLSRSVIDNMLHKLSFLLTLGTANVCFHYY